MYLQGYLLARPVPADEILAVIAAMPRHMESLLLSPPVSTDAPVCTRCTAQVIAAACAGVLRTRV